MNTSEKTCFKCKAVKPLEEFYKHGGMADGYLNKCKECTKLDVAIREALCKDKIDAYERARAKCPARKAKVKIYQRMMRERHPEKYAARTAVANAIRDGRLTRQPCEICGEKAQAHHLDYSKPLAVRWLCFEHHRQIAHKQKLAKA